VRMRRYVPSDKIVQISKPTNSAQTWSVQPRAENPLSQFVYDTDCTCYGRINHAENVPHEKFKDSHKKCFIFLTENEYVGVAHNPYQLVA
jgi:hypothetical protein